MKTLTKSDIPYSGDRIELPGGLYLTIETKHDETMGAPWEEHDGHGIISEQKHHSFGMGSKPPKPAPGSFSTADACSSRRRIIIRLRSNLRHACHNLSRQLARRSAVFPALNGAGMHAQPAGELLAGQFQLGADLS